jgi:hypothetical protein
LFLFSLSTNDNGDLSIQIVLAVRAHVECVCLMADMHGMHPSEIPSLTLSAGLRYHSVHFFDNNCAFHLKSARSRLNHEILFVLIFVIPSALIQCAYWLLNGNQPKQSPHSALYTLRCINPCVLVCSQFACLILQIQRLDESRTMISSSKAELYVFSFLIQFSEYSMPYIDGNAIF